MWSIKATNFRLHVTVLKTLGISLSGTDPKWYLIYSILMLTVLVYTSTIIETFELYAYWGGDLNIFANILGYQMTHLLGVAKVTTLLIYRQRIIKMLQNFETEPFQPNIERGGSWEVKYLNKVNGMYNCQTLMYYAIAGAVCTSGIVDAALSRIRDTPNKWHFPFVPCSLLDTTISPNYEIVFIYQTLCTPLYAGIISTIDCFIASVMAYLAAQLIIVQNSFRNVLIRAKYLEEKIDTDFLKPESEQDSASSGNMLSKTDVDASDLNPKYLETCLKQSIIHHIQILNTALELEEVFNIMVMIVFLGSYVLLCFLLFQTSMTPINSIEFLQSGSYCIVITFQIFLYCWWGNEVTVQSLKVAEAVNDINFIGAKNNFQKSLVHIVKRSQRPVIFTAGKFSPLSLETYKAIIHGSFSYYMVLHRLNEENA